MSTSCRRFNILPNFYFKFTFTTQLSFSICVVERVSRSTNIFHTLPFSHGSPPKRMPWLFLFIARMHRSLLQRKRSPKASSTNVPEVIRTPDLPLRRRSLYPAELQRQICRRSCRRFQIRIFDCIQTFPLNLRPSRGSPSRQLRLIATMKFSPQQLRSS